MKNKRLTLGSLFDGSGGFPLGGLLSGIIPVWASEIEPFPIRVTSKRLPEMKHYGDVSEMDGSQVEPVDIITFGSPCTDLSIAGKRAGLDGRQSGLFYQAVRIIKEMRCATDGKYPRYIVWENVPGAFSSNKGEDFRAVLKEIIGIVQPEAEMSPPEKQQWPYADLYVGDGWSVAYRTLDAQFWGVPQRRRRIFLVADFNGEGAGEILFKSEGMSGYSAEGFRAWQRAAGGAPESPGETSRMVLNDQGGCRMDVTDNVTNTLRAESHHPPLVFENHSQDTRYTGPLETAQTVSANYGIGGNNQPFVVESQRHPKTLKIRSGCDGGGKGSLIQEDKSATLSCNNDQTVFVPKAFGICSDQSHAMLSGNPKSGIYEADTSRTLDANGGNPSCNQGGIAVVAVQGSMIGREDKNGPQGNGVGDGISFTLNTVDRHAVAYPTYCCSKNSHFTRATEELAETLVATNYKDPPFINDMEEEWGYIVRRLTPTECARLQGFPDWWCSGLGDEEPSESEIEKWSAIWETHRKVAGSSTRAKSRKQIVKWLKNPYSDTAEYKMWGNGVALPCVYFVLSGIVWAAEKNEK